MVYNKFINCPDLSTFNSHLEAGDIVDQHIVFIQETKQIWTYGTFYGASSFSSDIVDKLENISQIIVTDGEGDKYLASDGTYKEIEENGYYMIPYALISLSNDSSSQDIIDALGGSSTFDNICNAIETDGKQLALYNGTSQTIISLNSFTEVNDDDNSKSFTFIICVFDEEGNIIFRRYTVTKNNDGTFGSNSEDIEGGSGIDYENETCVITLESNLGSTDAETLNGLKVTINNIIYTWQGTAIEAKVPANAEYTIEFQELKGYAKPNDQTGLVAVGGQTRQMKATYSTSVVTLNVQSNQSNPDSNLSGNIQIQVSYSDVSNTLDYEGSALSIKVPLGETITFTPSSGATLGYSTPSLISQSFELTSGSLTFTYNTTVFTITVNSNQSSTTDINGSTISVSYTGGSKTQTWRGNNLTFYVPTGSSYTFTASDVNGYRTPSAQSGTATGTTGSLTFTYQTELVNVTVNADEDSPSGFTLKIASSSTTYYSGSSASASVKIPFGTSYTVSVTAISGFTAPSNQSYTANQATRNITMTYSKIKSFGIEINSSQSDPSVTVGSEAQATLNSLLGKFRRCLCKYTSANNVSICYLRDDNSNYYHDGTAATLTGSEGDVMVYFPEFWYKGETISGGYRFNFSEYDMGSGWHHAPASLVGAYKANVSRSKLHSWSGVESQASTSMSSFHTYAQNRGTGFHLIDYLQHCTIGWMFMARYKHRNGQSQCGTGPNAYTGYPNGDTNSRGISDTTSGTTNTKVNFLGIEGCWGYKWEYMEGIHENGSEVVAYDKGWYDYSTSYNSITSSTKRRLLTGSQYVGGYMSDIIGGEYCDLVGANGADNGSSSTYWCDYCYAGASGSYWFVRSCGSSGTDGGPFCLDDTLGYGYGGSRLAFDGTITVVDSVSTFKSLANN